MYKLLIVDDSTVQIRSIKTMINWKELGIEEIKTAQNGVDGLALFKEFSPDIIITDVVMPIMTGIAMTEEIRKIKPSAKFIFISCHENFQYVSNALENDVSSYLLKPIDLEKLSETIKKVIETIETENDYARMNKLFEESMDIFRENFLWSILATHDVDTASLQDTLKNLGFSKYSHFIVVKVNINSGVNNYIDAYKLLEFTKNNLFTDIDGYIISQSKNSWVVIFMSADASNFQDRVKTALSQYLKLALEKHDVLLSAGLSRDSDSLFDAKFMLSQATSALESRVNCDEYGIYKYEDFEYTDIRYDILDLKYAISALIENVSPDGINVFLDKYYPLNAYLSYNYVKTLCTSTITILQLLLIERNLDIGNLFGSSAVIWDKLDKFETVTNARQWLYNMLLSVLEFICENDNNRYEKIVSAIIDNINRNYNNISNIEQLVADLYVSFSYAKSIFKKYTGRTIFDCLVRKRMEEAKKLLLDPEIKVYEVAELVGYSSRTHFSEIFRRYTGQTPKEFQQNH